MRHAKHNHQLGVKTAHRAALLSNMAAALLTHGRIRTTLAKAKALRPFTEKVITLAKKAKASDNPQKALHFRRQALSKVRDKVAVQLLFNELAEQFMNRNGGYTRIYKLVPRVGDGADMALIELVPASDEGYPKRKKPSKKKASKKTEEKTEETPGAPVSEESVEKSAEAPTNSAEAEADAEEKPSEEAEAAEPAAESTSEEEEKKS